jgi:hypothetical protein
LNNREKVKVLVAREGNLPLAPPASKPDLGEGSVKRAIPQGHQYNPRALKPLARTLFATSVALGHSITAYKEFARIKSSSISPDGLLGGTGYVMKVKDVRSHLQQITELLSTLTDTLHDELHAPHWQPEIKALDGYAEVEELIEEADEVLENPEQFGDAEVDEVERSAPKTKNLTDHIHEDQNKDSGASQVPGGGATETSEPKPAGDVFKVKQARDWKAPFIQRVANSSLPVNTLPGPRVDHLDRGEQTGPGGSYNKDEPLVQGDWGRTEGVGGEYLYTTPWENDTSRSASTQLVWGNSNLPSDNDTPTDARDFGLGYGAKGEGSEGYGTKNPDGRGVWGPQSELPNDPGGPMRDPGGEGSTPFNDNTSPANAWASIAESGLPFDGPDPVARSDYFEGDKGNQFNVGHHGTSGLPGMNFPSPDAPLIPRPSHNFEHMFADSELPGDGAVTYDHYRDISPNVGETFEQQNVPYVKWKSDVHDYRNDQQDLYREDYH